MGVLTLNHINNVSNASGTPTIPQWSAAISRQFGPSLPPSRANKNGSRFVSTATIVPPLRSCAEHIQNPVVSIDCPEKIYIERVQKETSCA
jgi:hypothetical protein